MAMAMRLRLKRLIRSGFISAVVSMGLVLCLNAPAWADYIYTYTGNLFAYAYPPYTTQDRVVVTFTLSYPLYPNLGLEDFSSEILPTLVMQDGFQTLKWQNPSLTSGDVSLGTDATGAINAWQVSLSDRCYGLPVLNPCQIHTGYNPNNSFAEDSAANVASPVAWVSSPGTWTVTPEPGTVALLAIGLVAMAGVRRRNA